MDTATKESLKLKYLTKQYVDALLWGHEPHVSGTAIENDGRRRPAVIKAFIAAGCIKPSKQDSYIITEKVVMELVAEQPDLVVISRIGDRDHYTLEKLCNEYRRAEAGVPLFASAMVSVNDLTTPQKWWLVQHPNDYRVAVSNGYGKWTAATIGSAMKGGWHAGLVVSNPALDEAVAAALHRFRVEQAYRQNLPWGLEHILAISEDEAKAINITSEQESRFPWGESHGATLSPDPAKWDEEIAKAITSAQARVDKATENLSRLKIVNTIVQRYGGWLKLAEEYRERIEKAIINEEGKITAKRAAPEEPEKPENAPAPVQEASHA